jgi:hypothetical protein
MNKQPNNWAVLLLLLNSVLLALILFRHDPYQPVIFPRSRTATEPGSSINTISGMTAKQIKEYLRNEAATDTSKITYCWAAVHASWEVLENGKWVKVKQ